MLCEPVPPAQALEWGLVSRVASRGELDAVVADLAAKLARKLPEAMRYTKTQLNWWRDLVWSQTVEHARDWLAVHSTADETREAVAAFHEKRRPRFAELRRLEAGEGRDLPVVRRGRAAGDASVLWGVRGGAAGPVGCGVSGSDRRARLSAVISLTIYSLTAPGGPP